MVRCSYISLAFCCAVLCAQDMRLVFENCKKYNPLPADPVRLAALKLYESFEQNWISSGLCAEVQRAKRATAGIAAPKFEPEEYDGAGQPPRNTTSHRSAEQQQRVQVSRLGLPCGWHVWLHGQCLTGWLSCQVGLAAATCAVQEQQLSFYPLTSAAELKGC
jgi:hypothetical protein